MATRDHRDTRWVDVPLQGPPPPRPIRVALAPTLEETPVAPEVADVVRTAGAYLEAAGYQVEVVELFDYALGRLVPREAGEALSEALAERGVKWHFGAACERVERDANALRVGLADGRTLEADAVLSAVGLRPRIALAEDAGLATDRGIVVDRQLRTSDPSIYALGDCKQIGELVMPFIMPIRPRLPDRPSFFIMSDIWRCIFNSWLTSWTRMPEPLATRSLRLAFIRSGLRRSCLVID